MAGMLTVRFAPSVIASVHRFARQDGMTVSQWIRRLVEKEMRRPERQPPVDVSAYPQSTTVTSGALTRVRYDCAPPTVTGYWPPEASV